MRTHTTHATPNPAVHTSTRRHPRFHHYLREAKVWAHFARRLGSERPFDPDAKKGQAIAQSQKLNARNLAFVVDIDNMSGPYTRGLEHLKSVLDETGARYVDLGAEVEYDEERDTDDVYLYIEDVRRVGTHKLRVARLPREDAFWIARLIRRSIHSRIYLLRLDRRTYVKKAAQAFDLRIAIGHVYELAKEYIDLMDDLAATRDDPAMPEMIPIYYADNVSLR